VLVAYAPIYTLPLPEGHRFPMQKYALIPDQLLYEGTLTAAHFFEPTPTSAETVLLAHNFEYFRRMMALQLTPQEVRRIGFPLTEQLVQREVVIAQGTIDCALHALSGGGVALNVAGGTHHAYADRGEGFCLLNDIAIAACYLRAKGIVDRVLVVDLDVHQGNGTAVIFQGTPEIFTFSMHGAANYPHTKEQSDLDIPLADGTTDAEYLRILHQVLPELIAQHRPEIIFYLSGVDVLATDKLGKLGLTPEGCRARDKFVFEECRQHNLPVAVSMGGGYSPRLADIVEAHCNTFRLAARMWD
jgi:acetoin utilization deacetylase AcuC-like enzyme